MKRGAGGKNDSLPPARALSALFGAAVDLALAAAAADLVLRFLVIAVYLLSIRGGHLGVRGFLILVGEPLALALAAVAALVARGFFGASSRRWPAAGAAFAALCLFHALRPAEVRTVVNGFGLASGRANSVDVEDFSGMANKDRYPVCRIRYNSLGYRDEEPSFAAKKGGRRVLLVGDSYVWGDGIPVNEETLGYLLRAELDLREPGRFSVMSAAYPGLGLRGYSRFIDALSPLDKPDVVVVGYLGESDDDPLDPQVLLDALPRSRPLRNLILNAGAVQDVHENSVRYLSRFWSDPENAASIAALVRDMGRKSAERGYRLILLSYFPHPPLPASIETLDLPAALRYHGRSSELWYAKDSHPKTKLNRMLAKLLADTLVSERR